MKGLSNIVNIYYTKVRINRENKVSIYTYLCGVR